MCLAPFLPIHLESLIKKTVVESRFPHSKFIPIVNLTDPVLSFHVNMFILTTISQKESKAHTDMCLTNTERHTTCKGKKWYVPCYCHLKRLREGVSWSLDSRSESPLFADSDQPCTTFGRISSLSKRTHARFRFCHQASTSARTPKDKQPRMHMTPTHDHALHSRAKTTSHSECPSSQMYKNVKKIPKTGAADASGNSLNTHSACNAQSHSLRTRA